MTRFRSPSDAPAASWTPTARLPTRIADSPAGSIRTMAEVVAPDPSRPPHTRISEPAAKATARLSGTGRATGSVVTEIDPVADDGGDAPTAADVDVVGNGETPVGLTDGGTGPHPASATTLATIHGTTIEERRAGPPPGTRRFSRRRRAGRRRPGSAPSR